MVDTVARACSGTWTPGAGQTQLFSGACGNVAGVASQEAGSPTATMAWSFQTSAASWSQMAVPVKPVQTETTLTGAGVTVAVLDSGLLQDGGGTDRILTTRDFTGGSSTPPRRLGRSTRTGTARMWLA